MVIRELAALNLQWALSLAEERYRAERLGPPLVRVSTPGGAEAPSGDQAANDLIGRKAGSSFWR